MQMLWVPSYCGGRLIVGLYTPNNPWDADAYKNTARYQNKLNNVGTYDEQLRLWSRAGLTDEDRAAFAPNAGNIPTTLEDFAYHLRALLGSIDNNVGTLTAVTNRSQDRAAGFLEKCGFINAARTEKYSGYGHCITWVGDVHKKVRPAIDKLIGPNYKPEVLGGEPVKKKKSIFAAFAPEDM